MLERQRGVVGVPRVARPCDLGDTGSTALRMFGVSECPQPRRRYLDEMQPIAQQLQVGRVSLAVSTHDAGNNIGHPQPRLECPPAVLDMQANSLREVEPGLLDDLDVATIQHLLSRFHEQLRHPAPVQFEGEVAQADRSGALLLARCNRCSYRNHMECIEASDALRRGAPVPRA